ncbi:Quinoprotein glucose dehydrogenase B precursor [Phycisphaerae bacterium RAS1]|nr:Quinoprotein glucose dehydrogenase B precursor [Phycisphaerae bacterium RAS1]
MRMHSGRFCAFAAILAVTPILAPAGVGIPELDTVRVASGLSRPLYVTAPEGDFARIFILEQFSGTTGRIRILNIPGNTLNATPYLSISPVSTGNEQGLLGMAFHPDFLNNGYFWVDYTNSAGTTVIARYQANAPYATSTTANAASATTVLTIAQPFTNHNGGWVAFGPDGYLYIGMGDGGSANDPNGNGQNINVLLGKMLRIDVDGADNIPGNDDDDGAIGMTLPPYTSPSDNPFAGVIAGMDQIWSIGLRNPWRNSFDRATGDLYIGDVGQNAIEEIDFQTGGMAGTPVRNYGWRCMEGTSCTGLTGCTCNAANLTLPISQYSHAGGRCSLTGGYVYRGCAIPELNGVYFFADYCTAEIFSFTYSGSGSAPAATSRTAELAPGGGLAINTITSFGEDALGEIYICDQGGEVFKIVSAASVLIDCNANGQQDGCDIASGASLDTNANGIPDECEGACCLSGGECSFGTSTDCGTAGGTYQGNGTNCLTAECAPPCLLCGDTNCDGAVDILDINPFIAAVGDACATPLPGGCDCVCAADTNGDGNVDILDINPFISALEGSPCPAP